jgi:hypothetical protein
MKENRSVIANENILNHANRNAGGDLAVNGKFVSFARRLSSTASESFSLFRVKTKIANSRSKYPSPIHYSSLFTG